MKTEADVFEGAGGLLTRLITRLFRNAAPLHETQAAPPAYQF